MKTLFALSLIFATFTTAFSQQLNVPKNKIFEITNRTIDTVVRKSDESYTYAFRSLGRNVAGNNLFECRIVKAILNANKQTYLNTDSLRKLSLNNSAVLFPVAMLNKPFTVIVSNKGKVLNIENLETTLKVSLDKWNIHPEIQQQLLNNSGKPFVAEIQTLFYQMPDNRPSNSPATWTDKETGAKYNLTIAKGGLTTLSMSAENEGGVKYTSKFTFYTSTGLLQNAVSKTVNMVKIPNNLGVEVSTASEVVNIKTLANTVTKSGKIDSGWLDMAVKFGYWSNELKTGGEYDSLKVLNAIKQYDAVFSNDPYYLISKLNAIQQIRNYQLYDKTLIQVPNQYLKGNDSHLFNKLSTIHYSGTVQEAYDVTTYFYNTRSFTDWTDNSFAQDFLAYDESPERKKQELKSTALLNMFISNGNPVYLKKTKPLYLWVKAKGDKDNAALQLQTASAFIKMDDQEMKDGKGCRYALLMYYLLQNVNKPDAADSLLDNTIIKLQKYTADSLDYTRKESQNLLAHAYYLKSLTETDQVKSIEYLSKAAEYSPKTDADKAYGSFYDRVFLHSKESYRNDYIEKLLVTGHKEEAIKLFAVEINSDPEGLSNIQKRYELQFPDDNFKDFFTQYVLNSWAVAPDFKLQNINGKVNTLSEFKDKWLVLDFWGTWCGPCKEELPDVNKFYTELSNGKHGDSNFLSIACYDTEDKVKSFLDLNKYTIPVVMSDSKVEKSYEIAGYPSKIIISPEGKMLKIQFGKDWKGILKKFNDIYASK